MMTLFILLGSSAFAKEKFKPKSFNLNVKKIGIVRVVYDVPGEPMAQPERLQVFMKCPGSNKEIRSHVFRMCIFDGYDYEEDVEHITFKLGIGKVDPKSGSVNCETIRTQEIDFTTACADLKKSK